MPRGASPSPTLPTHRTEPEDSDSRARAGASWPRIVSAWLDSMWGPNPGAPAPGQRRHHRQRLHAGRGVVGVDGGGVAPAVSPVGVGPQPGQSGAGPHQWAVAHAPAPWAARAEGAALGGDDPGIDRPRLRRGEPRAL